MKGARRKFAGALLIFVVLLPGCAAIRNLFRSSDEVARAIKSSDTAIQQLPDAVSAARGNLDDFAKLRTASTLTDDSVAQIIQANGGIRAQARPYYQNLDKVASALEARGQAMKDEVVEALITVGCAAMDYYADWGSFPSFEGFALYLAEAVAEDVFELPDIEVAEVILKGLAPLQSGQTVATWVALTVAACDQM